MGLAVVFQHQFVMIGIILVGRDNHLLTRLKSAEHLIIPGILSPDADVALHGEFFSFIQNKYPLTASGLVRSRVNRVMVFVVIVTDAILRVAIWSAKVRRSV